MKSLYDTCKDNYKGYEEQYTLEEMINILDTKSTLSNIYQEVEDINKELLYKSHTHGLSHNQRVVFFAFIICLFENISGDDYTIIMDACKYHDIGRQNDEEDSKHGIRSSEMINQIFRGKGIYTNSENLGYLRSIVELHSNSDADNKFYFEKYKLNNYNRFVRLYSVLKDADGLDRVRLCPYYPDIIWLDPKYLRTKTGVKLIRLAHEVNYIIV